MKSLACQPLGTCHLLGRALLRHHKVLAARGPTCGGDGIECLCVRHLLTVQLRGQRSPLLALLLQLPFAS